MKWITRERPKIDRIACPWLIRRFIDPDAEILYVPTDQVLAVAGRQLVIVPTLPPSTCRGTIIVLRAAPVVPAKNVRLVILSCFISYSPS